MLKHIKYFITGIAVITAVVLIIAIIGFIKESITDEIAFYIKASFSFLLLIGIIYCIGLLCYTFYTDVIKNHRK